MKKLSDLVNLYNQLCSLTALGAKESTDKELQKITTLSNDTELDFLRLQLLDMFNHFENHYELIKERVRLQIREEERSYLQDSYKFYEEIQGFRYQWFNLELPDDLSSDIVAEQAKTRAKNILSQTEFILTSKLDLSEDAQEFIKNRILQYSSWQKTTMIIRPALEPWIDILVSNDPLYLVDDSYDLLTPAMEKFNDLYRSRLRAYTIREDQEGQDILWRMPDNQFGVVLAYNYFNHKPFEIIRQYLEEIFNKMRPGGSLLMTYNDCDRWEGVKAVEHKSGLYTPGFLIIDFAKSLGFEQGVTWHENGPWTWVEFHKPGEWDSLRGGQCLAKILPK